MNVEDISFGDKSHTYVSADLESNGMRNYLNISVKKDLDVMKHFERSKSMKNQKYGKYLSDKDGIECDNSIYLSEETHKKDVHTDTFYEKVKETIPLYFDRMIKVKTQKLSRPTTITAAIGVTQKGLKRALINEWFLIAIENIQHRKTKVPLAILWPLLYLDSIQIQELEQLRRER